MRYLNPCPAWAGSFDVLCHCPWFPVLVLILSLSYVGPVFAQGSGQLKDLPINSYPEGLSIRVNGQPYKTPVTVQIDPTKPFVAEVDNPLEQSPGTHYQLEAWSLLLLSGSQQFLYEPRISLQNATDLGDIFLTMTAYYAVSVVAVGPGRIDNRTVTDANGYVRAGSQFRATAYPDPGAIFVRWEGSISTTALDLQFQVAGPLSVVARFVVPHSPPAILTVSGTFPTFRYRSSQDLLESSVSVTSDGIFSSQGFYATCGSLPEMASVSATNTLAPFNLTVRIIPSNADRYPDGLYQCKVLIYRNDAGPTFEIPFSVRLGPVPPEPSATRVAAAVDGASYRAISMAPGSIFSVFGELLADEATEADQLPLPTQLRSTQLRVTVGSQSRIAPLFYVSPTQLNFMVPMDLPYGGGFLEVLREGLGSPPFPITVEPLAPALFTANSDGRGAPAGYYIRAAGDNQVRGELYTCPEKGVCVPLPIQSPDPNEEVFLILFGTGFRNFTAIKPEVQIGTTLAEVTFVGAHPDFAGLDQINVKVPHLLLGSGLQTVKVKHLGKTANEVMVHF